MKAITLVNRRGGRAGADARDRVSLALTAAGIEGPVELIDGDQLAARARAAVDHGAALVIAAGGDGSQSAVAGALAGTGCALGILPLGTLNHLARDLAIPSDLDEAAAVIASGHRRRIDLAEMNGKIFVNNSAIGLYPLMVLDRISQQVRLGRSKRLAMMVASARTLWRFHDQRLRLTVNNGEQELLDTPLLFVGNNDYRLALPAAGRRQTLDDGRLCVMVMRRKGVLGLLAAMARALVGLTRPDDMVRLDNVRELRVESVQSRVTVSVDGETCALDWPLTYRILPGALTVIAPIPGA
ncbi:diacylglycerol kinase family lipid kinase [Sphingomonas rhizophila]|uniref:Diacylglycerol kinase family lipid kinase n=1 Tax=Sphingomonas rhizophila TaxID=2071607 RepID=A0A7G9S9S4_9SPHN|nr:diacylglycerol kinase family protein [Sphingomonas rhizophila]QNN64599.1 diacylglycerol kinase family lipid kinase [Sphingomonas rhizophila]